MNSSDGSDQREASSSDDYDDHDHDDYDYDNDGEQSESNVGNEHASLHEISRNDTYYHHDVVQRSGSMVSFPSSIRMTDKVQTEQQYLRRLEARGVDKLYLGRCKRTRQRKSLLNGDLQELTKTIIALQSSSSEDDSDDGRIDLPTIDWGQAAWGSQESLFGHLPLSDFTSLIGWAHYLKSDDDCPQNDLMDVPNIPLAPSLLKFIRAQAVVTTMKPGSITWKTKAFLANEDPEVHLKTKHWQKKRRLDQHKEFWAYNSDDETYQWMKENWKPTLAFTVTAPVPSRKKIVMNKPIPLDTSAQVALGMVIEEILTSNFIPLARHHVAACREKADAFDDWTMPAEEAILASQSASPLPSLVDVNGQGDPDLVAKWCKSRGLDAIFVQNNMHVYSKLLPCPPSVTTAGVIDRKLTSQLSRLQAIKEQTTSVADDD